MKKVVPHYIICLFFIFITFNLLGQSASFEEVYWTNGNDEATSIIQTSDGGYAIIGSTDGFGYGGYDVLLIKINYKGDIEWTGNYGGINNDYGRAISPTNDGGYIIAGNTNSYGAGLGDIFLIKTDSLGNTIWTKTFGGINDDAARAVFELNNGDFIIAGSTLSFGAGLYDLYLIRTNSLGVQIWSKAIGTSYDEIGRAMQPTSDGGFIIAGSTNKSGNYDAFLVKTNSAGDTLWTKRYGGTVDDFGYAVIQTIDKGYALTGFNGGIFLIKTDSVGQLLYNTTLFTGLTDNKGYSIKQTNDQGFIINGIGGNIYENDIIIKADKFGDFQWKKEYGAPSSYSDAGNSIIITNDGGYISAGYTYGYTGSSDFYVIKTDSNGCICPQVSAGNDICLIYGNSTVLNGIIKNMVFTNDIIYNWYPTIGLNCSNCQHPTALPGNSISYVLTANNTCYSSTDTVHITVGTKPLITPLSPVSTCSPDSVILEAGGGFLQYLWSQVYDTTPIVCLHESGIYTVQGRVEDCWFISDPITVIIDTCTSLNKTASDDLLIYPNPSNSILYIELTTTSQDPDGKIMIYDTRGRLLKNISIDKLITAINISDFKNGLYFIKIENEKEIIINRFIKE
ncbi:MAG TPA: T9SS type A sorting domain-containing protein [Bacteroidales bacterium]|nr:T9SS type A sorting domain-containing protein [Bacteroidales bacterium]